MSTRHIAAITYGLNLLEIFNFEHWVIILSHLAQIIGGIALVLKYLNALQAEKTKKKDDSIN